MDEPGESPPDHGQPRYDPANVDRPLSELFGIEPNFAPDDLAPRPDERRLAAFVRGDLPAGERSEIWELVTSFRSWFDAWRAIVQRDGDPQEERPPIP